MFGNLRQLHRLRTPEEKWEQSRDDTAALLEMLHPFAVTLPASSLQRAYGHLRQQPSKHVLRWALVSDDAHFIKKLSWPMPYTDASERLADTFACGGSFTMKSSYQLEKRRTRQAVNARTRARVKRPLKLPRT